MPLLSYVVLKLHYLILTILSLFYTGLIAKILTLINLIHLLVTFSQILFSQIIGLFSLVTSTSIFSNMCHVTTMQSNNYFPQISRPTRFPDNNSAASPSLLDHIWTNFNESASSGILHFPLSDHLPILINISVLSQPYNKIH